MLEFLELAVEPALVAVLGLIHPNVRPKPEIHRVVMLCLTFPSVQPMELQIRMRAAVVVVVVQLVSEAVFAVEDYLK